MDIRVEFDEGDFEKAVMGAAESGVKDLVDQYNRDYARMARHLEGKPLEEIKAELVRYHERDRGEISEPELTEYAEQLQTGGKITFEYGGTVG